MKLDRRDRCRGGRGPPARHRLGRASTPLIDTESAARSPPKRWELNELPYTIGAAEPEPTPELLKRWEINELPYTIGG